MWVDDPVAVAGHDTTVIQLTFNEPGEATDAWRAARRRLTPLVADLPKPDVWGQTLIYEATLSSDADADAALEAVLPSLRQSPPPNHLDHLARTAIEGGQLWLLAVPRRGEGLAASTVYAALVPAERERAFVQRVLRGRAAWLLLPDLIATKGYFQRREHLGVGTVEGDKDDWYRAILARLRDVTTDLLTDLGKRVAETDEVDDLARAYGPVAATVPWLKQLHISVLQQVHNFDLEQGRLGDNAILAYHRQHLETAAYELDLKLVDGQDALDAARGAGDLTQVWIDREQVLIERQQVLINREQEQRQYLIQTMLALVGAGFAMPQVVDKVVASAFLDCLGFHASVGGYSVWWLVLIRGVAIALFAILLLAVGRFLSTWRRR